MVWYRSEERVGFLHLVELLHHDAWSHIFTLADQIIRYIDCLSVLKQYWSCDKAVLTDFPIKFPKAAPQSVIVFWPTIIHSSLLIQSLTPWSHLQSCELEQSWTPGTPVLHILRLPDWNYYWDSKSVITWCVDSKVDSLHVYLWWWAGEEVGRRPRCLMMIRPWASTRLVWYDLVFGEWGFVLQGREQYVHVKSVSPAAAPRVLRYQ